MTIGAIRSVCVVFLNAVVVARPGPPATAASHPVVRSGMTSMSGDAAESSSRPTTTSTATWAHGPAREPRGGAGASRPAPPGPSARGARPGRGARSVPALLRARPRPHQALRGRGGAWRASARCSSPPRTTTSAPGSPTRSRWRRWPTGIARAANLCVPLTEAIALAHDCGHGPAGHASEEAFSPYLPDGYDHAVYGADVTLAPLNLCVETLDGVRNHSWRRPAPATPEGEVVAWADRIAYVCHDFEDAVRAGILEPDDLPAEVARRRRATRSSAQIGAFVRRRARRHRPHRRRSA